MSDNAKTMDTPYRESIEKLFESLLVTVNKANVLNADGIDFERLNKDNLIKTGLHHKEDILNHLNLQGMPRMMISNTLPALIPSPSKDAKVIPVDGVAVRDAFIEFFKENAHIVEGLPELLEKIAEQMKARKTAK